MAMYSNISVIRNKNPLLLFIIFYFLFSFSSVFASTTLSTPIGQINLFLNDIANGLLYISAAIVTIALIFAGFEIIFNDKIIDSLIPIVVGALVIISAKSITEILLPTGDICFPACWELSKLFIYNIFDIFYLIYINKIYVNILIQCINK